MERPPQRYASPTPLVKHSSVLNPDELRSLPAEKLFAMMDALNETSAIVHSAILEAGYNGHVYNMNEKQLECRLQELETEKLLVREAIEFCVATTERRTVPPLLSANGTTTSNLRAYVGHSRTSVPLDQVLNQQQHSPAVCVEATSVMRHRKSNVQKKLDFSL